MSVTLSKFTFPDNLLDPFEFNDVTRVKREFTTTSAQTITVLEPLENNGVWRIDSLTVTVGDDNYAYGFSLRIENTTTNHETYIIRNRFCPENSVATLIDKSNPLWINDTNMKLKASISSQGSSGTDKCRISYSASYFGPV